MVLFINILLLNPDEMIEHQVQQGAGKGALGAYATGLTKSVVDHETLTATIAHAIRANAEKDMREKHGLNVQLRVKESHSLYCVIELHVKKQPPGVMHMFSVCCEPDNAVVYLTEGAMALKFPSSLKAELKNEKIDADVVVVKDIERQEQYESKVLDLLYPEGQEAHGDPNQEQTFLDIFMD